MLFKLFDLVRWFFDFRFFADGDGAGGDGDGGLGDGAGDGGAGDGGQGAGNGDGAGDGSGGDGQGEGAGDGGQGTGEEGKSKGKSPEERVRAIHQATAQKYQAIRAAQEAEASLQAKIEEYKKLQGGDAPVEPNIDDFDNTESYIAAMKKHAAQVAEIGAQKKAEEMVRSQSAQNLQREIYSKYHAKKMVAAGENPNFELNEMRVGQIIREFQNPAMEQAIIQSDKSIELINYLANHMDEASRIAQMPPTLTVMELGGLLSKVTKKTNKQPSNLPEPVQAASGGGVVSKDPSEMSQAEYDAYMNKKQYGF